MSETVPPEAEAPAAPPPYEIKPGSAVYCEDGQISCEVRMPHVPLPEGEWLPFNAGPNDVEAAGQDVYARLLDGEAGPIAPYVAPPPVVPASVTRAQARIALLEHDLLDDAEAVVASHPYQQVRIWWADALNFERSHPYLVALAIEIELSEQQVDDLFIYASTRA